MLELQLSPFPLLNTERLLLRPMEMTDLDVLHALRTNEEVMRYINKDRQTKEEVAQMIQRVHNDQQNNDAISWAISLHEQTTLIGTIGLWRVDKAHHRAEIGYILHPDHWRKGILSEALKAVMEYGFGHMKLHSLEGHINPLNEASAGVLEKNGFVKEAYFKENYHHRGQFFDTIVYSKLNNR